MKGFRKGFKLLRHSYTRKHTQNYFFKRKFINKRMNTNYPIYLFSHENLFQSSFTLSFCRRCRRILGNDIDSEKWCSESFLVKFSIFSFALVLPSLHLQLAHEQFTLRQACPKFRCEMIFSHKASSLWSLTRFFAAFSLWWLSLAFSSLSNFLIVRSRDATFRERKRRKSRANDKRGKSCIEKVFLLSMAGKPETKEKTVRFFCYFFRNFITNRFFKIYIQNCPMRS